MPVLITSWDTGVPPGGSSDTGDTVPVSTAPGACAHLSIKIQLQVNSLHFAQES